MNISLTPQLEEIVKKKVDSGRYHSVSEVIREAIRILEERDRLQEIKLEALRNEVSVGLEQLDHGEGLPLNHEEIKTEGRRRLAQKQKSRSA